MGGHKHAQTFAYMYIHTHHAKSWCVCLADIEYADTPGVVTTDITGAPVNHFHIVVGIVKPIEMPSGNLGKEGRRGREGEGRREEGKAGREGGRGGEGGREGRHRGKGGRKGLKDTFTPERPYRVPPAIHNYHRKYLLFTSAIFFCLVSPLPLLLIQPLLSCITEVRFPWFLHLPQHKLVNFNTLDGSQGSHAANISFIPLLFIPLHIYIVLLYDIV